MHFIIVRVLVLFTLPGHHTQRSIRMPLVVRLYQLLLLTITVKEDGYMFGLLCYHHTGLVPIGLLIVHACLEFI